MGHNNYFVAIHYYLSVYFLSVFFNSIGIKLTILIHCAPFNQFKITHVSINNVLQN